MAWRTVTWLVMKSGIDADQLGYIDVDERKLVIEWEDTGTGLRLVRVEKAPA
jgi:hypothetical protein